MSLTNCPVCLCKSRIAASEQITNETRRQYNQCQNLNCGVIFNTLTTLEKIIKSPQQGSSKPDPTKQPDLMKDPNQMDLLASEPLLCMG